MSDKRRVLLCDIGNVLVTFDNGRAERQLLALAPQVTHSVLPLLQGQTWDAFVIGELDDRGYRDRVRLLLGPEARITDQQIDDAVADVFEPITETLEVLRRARVEGLKIVALSNTEPPRVRQLERMGIMDVFDDRVLSCEVGLRKPDPGIFGKALKVAGVSPKEAMFTDDILSYVEAAARLGIAAHHFTGPVGLIGFLREYGYLR